MPIISCFPTKSKNDDRYLQLVGGMMSGSINMGGQKITNVGAPANATDAVRQQDLEVVSQEVDHILDGTTPAYIPAATDAKIGGVIVGENLSVESNGTLSVDTDSTPTSGSVKPVQSGGVYTALQGYIPTSQKGTVSGVASLGSDGKVPASQLPEMDYVPNSQVGTAGGVAELDSTGKVPSSQLPSYVDDVEEYDTRSAFPGTGESGKIYVTKDTNLTYRWSGTEYVEISPSLALGETSATAYRGDRGKAAYDHSQITSGNPHGTTAADVGARPNTWMPSASDVGARPDTWTPTAEDVGALTQELGDERYVLLTGGTTGQMLYQGESGAEWGDKPVMYVKINKSDGVYSINKTFSDILAAYQSGRAVMIGDPSGFYLGGVITEANNNRIKIYDPTTINNGRRITISNDDTVTTEEVPILPSATDENQVLIAQKPYGDNPPNGYNVYTYEWSNLSEISSVVCVHLEGLSYSSLQSDMSPSEIRSEFNNGKLVVCAQTFMGAKVSSPTLLYCMKGSSTNTALFVGLDDEMNTWKATVSSDKSATMEIVSKYLPISGGDITGSLTVTGVLQLSGGDPTIPTQAANKGYVDQKAPKYRTVTLPAASWSDNSQTVTVNGVKASETAQLIQPMPAVASQDAYIAAGVICSGQAANQLTFKCSTVPAEDLTLYVVLTEVSA